MSPDGPDGPDAGGRSRPRLRRRAVGPAGAVRGDEPPLPPAGLLDPPDAVDSSDPDERLRADRPPHHDRGV